MDLDVERALSVGDGDERALVKKWCGRAPAKRMLVNRARHGVSVAPTSSSDARQLAVAR